MKKIYTLAGALLFSFASKAQTVASDFTANDCSGVSHHLYEELANGKVVVLVWVMPCFGCVAGTHVADSLVNAMQATSPNILFWVSDDGVPSGCATVLDWLNANHLGRPVIFGNDANEINQSNYGGDGMPHIVVIGPDRNIYYNEKGSTGIGLAHGIQNAVNGTGLSVASIAPHKLTVSPNPASDVVNISSPEPAVSFSIIAANGVTVAARTFDKPNAKTTIDVSGLPVGNYWIQACTPSGLLVSGRFFKK